MKLNLLNIRLSPEKGMLICQRALHCRPYNWHCVGEIKVMIVGAREIEIIILVSLVTASRNLQQTIEETARTDGTIQGCQVDIYMIIFILILKLNLIPQGYSYCITWIYHQISRL